MSSPNEPGPSARRRRTGSGNGSTVPDGGPADGSAGQRDGRRRAAVAARACGTRPPRSTEAPRAARGRVQPAGSSPGADARLNRFISGRGHAPADTSRTSRRAASGASAPTGDRRRPRRPRADRAERRARRPTPASCPTCPAPRRARPQRKPAVAGAQPSRRAPVAPTRVAGGQPHAGARCGRACRSGGSTRGAR